jgi:hypothetical protein
MNGSYSIAPASDEINVRFAGADNAGRACVTSHPVSIPKY